MLSHHKTFFAQVIFLTKVVCQLWTNTAQVKALWDLCSVVEEASDNIAQEKILFNVVLILFGQHGTVMKPCAILSKRLQTTQHRKHPVRKHPVQCCHRYSWNNTAQVNTLCNVVLEALRQHCITKNPFQCCLNSLGTTLH